MLENNVFCAPDNRTNYLTTPSPGKTKIPGELHRIFDLTVPKSPTKLEKVSNRNKTVGISKPSKSRKLRRTFKLPSPKDQAEKRDWKHEKKLFRCQRKNIDLYSCKRCSFKTEFLLFLKKHIREQHSSGGPPLPTGYLFKVYTCLFCSFDTCSRLQYLSHAEKCAKNQLDVNKMFHCDKCSHTAKQDRDLRIHRICKHPVKNNTGCFSKDMSQVESEHSYGLKIYNCKKCSFQSYFSLTYASHVKKCYEEQNVKLVQRFKCQKCSFESVKRSVVRKHLRAEHPVKPPTTNVKLFDCQGKIEPYSCPKCRIKTNVLIFYNKHMKDKSCGATALDMQSFYCRHCSFITYSSLFWLKHTRQCIYSRTKSEKQYKCDRCLYQTKWISKFQWHRKYRHLPKTNLTWYKCDQCTYETKSQKGLNLHKCVKHRGPITVDALVKCIMKDHSYCVKPYFCENCHFESYLPQLRGKCCSEMRLVMKTTQLMGYKKFKVMRRHKDKVLHFDTFLKKINVNDLK